MMVVYKTVSYVRYRSSFKVIKKHFVYSYYESVFYIAGDKDEWHYIPLITCHV